MLWLLRDWDDLVANFDGYFGVWGFELGDGVWIGCKRGVEVEIECKPFVSF